MGQKFLKFSLGLGILLGVGYFFYNIGVSEVQDLNYAKKAEDVSKELKDIRRALEIYYQRTGGYPDLTREEVWNNLELLDFIDDKGENISFAKIYGRNDLAKTPDIYEGSGDNKVFNVQNFKNVTHSGGWNYNYDGKTGEIRINLPKDAFHQGIDWSRH